MLRVRAVLKESSCVEVPRGGMVTMPELKGPGGNAAPVRKSQAGQEGLRDVRTWLLREKQLLSEWVTLCTELGEMYPDLSYQHPSYWRLGRPNTARSQVTGIWVMESTDWAPRGTEEAGEVQNCMEVAKRQHLVQSAPYEVCRGGFLGVVYTRCFVFASSHVG